MDPQISDFDENDFFNDKKFLIREIQRQSNELSFVTKLGKSEVWNRFVRVYYDNNETDYVKCIHCEDIQKQTQYSGTSGLLKHKCQQMVESEVNPTEESVTPVIQRSLEESDYFDESLAETTSDLPLKSRDFYMSALQSSDPLVSLRRHRGKSSVWDRFERIFYNNCETEFVKCKYCDDIQKHTNNFGTGALLKHRCGVFADTPLVDEQEKEVIEANPLNDKTLIKEMVKNSDQRLSFVREMKKSEVWDRFERIFIDDFETLYVKCKYCECVQKHTPSGGTQGLRKHRCPAMEVNGTSFSTNVDGVCDSVTDQLIDGNTVCDQKDYIKHLTEENNTLRQIVEKCLNIIDDCLCVNKYSSQQRKDVNVLVNKYNKYLFKAKRFGKTFQNQENIETNDKFLDTNKLLSVGTNRDNLVNCGLNSYQKRFKRRQQITNSIKNKYQKRYVCDWTECGKKFRLERHLTEHRDTIHLMIKNHECQWPGCEETFLRKSQLNVHILKYHSNARFSCDQCSYKTTYKALLLRHQRIHAEEKCIGCDWPGCDFKTNYEQGLKAHKLTHSGERPFRCSWPSCEWSFRQRHHLKAHMLKHTGEKPISCQYSTCDRRFASRQAMKFHFEKIHK